MKTQLFLLLLALSVLRTQAQSLSIKGRVTDASQEAVVAANVSLWTIDSTLVTGVTSDAQGKFALPKIKAGDYRLSISFIGLQSENILLKLNKSLDLGDVQLQEDAVSLGEVTVSASNVLQRVDRQIILPSESQLKRSFGAYDLLNNLGIARLQVDKFTNSMSISDADCPHCGRFCRPYRRYIVRPDTNQMGQIPPMGTLDRIAVHGVLCVGILQSRHRG